MMISSVYSSIELRCFARHTFHTLSIACIYLSIAPLLLFLSQFCLPRQFHRIDRRLFLNLVSAEIFTVLHELFFVFISKAHFQIFKIQAILGSGIFQHMLQETSLSMILVNRHLFGHSLTCVFLLFCLVTFAN